jgi:DNA-binding GntR family transcriptional regulator
VGDERPRHPLESVPDLAEPGSAGATTVIGPLDERLPEPTAASITVMAAGAEFAEHLGREPGRALLRIDQVCEPAAGRRMELAVSHALPEHCPCRVRLRRGGRWRFP